MRHANLARVALLAALPLLGGCQSLFGKATARTDFRAVQSAGLISDTAEGFLADGRRALDEGRYAAAIDAFRFARLSPDTEAAAYNGLAIAYSQLGRNDLTERFFRRAVTLDSGNVSYRRNFALFLQKHPVALPMERVDQPAPSKRHAAAVLSPAIEHTPSSSLRPNGPVRVELPSSRLVAAGAGQVMISSDPYASTAASKRRQAIKSPQSMGNSYPIKISFSEPSEHHSGLSISSGGPANSYPVRINLKVSND